MTISDWLDQQEAQGLDVTTIDLPDDLAYTEDPDETIFFAEVRPCSILCTGNHPFSTVERFGHWYYSRGQDRKAGIHSSKEKWHLFTRDKDLALQTAHAHLR